jgi:hypothetical protein
VQFCLERGIVTAANVVDHVTPHKGDHKSAKQEIELRGYRTDIGLDGCPTDHNHAFNRAR